ncbi:Carboxylesterase [Fusarium falciforme]|uniref:Carboxylesterase n=1 Tax=Fusarium falciforme TaxID=195108 RepID=UPI002301C488|nr:Carboxylesterase [Fusarium falciforme]WAO90085.1 Carboxylesterase [Fusarium falciforme]
MGSASGRYNHPVIGNVQGNEADGVVQFLGVKYGVLDHWFDNARLPSYDGSGLIAMKHGPQAISDPAGVDVEHLIIQKALPKPEPPGCSGTECLNMNITVPQEASPSSKFPVMVFIHGGGFFTGANWWPQVDTKQIVRLSIQQGQPIIAININYRLGMPGFLTSLELRDAGFQSNNGHHDQRVALRWIKQYISGFGGDPDRVTVAGESIGGLSALRALSPDEKLAWRVVVLAGAPPLMTPPPLETAELPYQQVLKALEVEGGSPAKRIQALKDASPEYLSAKIDKGIMFTPLVDGKLIPSQPTFDAILNGNPPWKNTSCEAAFVGYAPLDASVLGIMGLFQRKLGIGAAFSDHVRSNLPHQSQVADKLLEIYKISDEKSDDEALLSIIQFASDIGYRATAHALAKTFPGESFLLQFSEPNPWEGPFKGHTTHVLDIAFLFQNYNDHLDSQQRASAIQFAHDVILFMHDHAPWDNFQKIGGMAIYENGTKKVVEGRDTMTEEYASILELGDIVGLDFLIRSTVCTNKPVGHDQLYSIWVGRFLWPDINELAALTLILMTQSPRCPQVPVDVGHLLRIPSDVKLPIEPEDEFNCLNLDIVAPKDFASQQHRLPVMVWIHGMGISSRHLWKRCIRALCKRKDFSAIVKDSLKLGKPILAVFVQYRLNIFGFGDETSEGNLGLRDQALALDWVRCNISGFGGDPDAITLAGESAGAVYSHAHLVCHAPAKQFVLSSGSLHLSPPQPVEKAQSVRQALNRHLRSLGDFDLRTAPVEVMIEAIKVSGIQSWFLVADDVLQDWKQSTGSSERLLLSDVRSESIIWREGIWTTSIDRIDNAFDLASEYSSELKSLYNIRADRPSSCRIGALDFINDYKFVLPVEKMTKQWRQAQKPVFRCLVDEENPWQSSNGAHHGIDLVFLFGGFDSGLPDGARRTGEHMRKAWIDFISQQDPWPAESYAAFGPFGMCHSLDDKDLGSRRRMRQVAFLSQQDTTGLDRAFAALATGNISLLN